MAGTAIRNPGIVASTKSRKKEKKKDISDDITFNLYIDTIYIGNGNIIDGLVLPKKDTATISSLLIIQKNYLDQKVWDKTVSHSRVI